mmetsp:Transcript_1439/g.1962  ORF Transcript_1439/g.1962 Transcript_1439/m.1962 type:complete len:437 (+) Transcript_1439:117-1427(+)
MPNRDFLLRLCLICFALLSSQRASAPAVVEAFQASDGLDALATGRRCHHSNIAGWSRLGLPPKAAAAADMAATPARKRTCLHMASDLQNKYQQNFLPVEPSNIWEQMAMQLINVNEQGRGEGEADIKGYVQAITVLRVSIPSLAAGAFSGLIYPTMSMALANYIDDPGVFAVVSQDASQYIQNILTTSGLVFSILVGQTFYFMYQQQEAIYLALFEEVAMAKSLLEQVALVSQGRVALYQQIMKCIDRYVTEDLTRFNDAEPAVLISARPVDDPLEDILYLTSVGEPSIVYQTVRSLRQARSYRLGALQRKLPDIHMTLLWTLFGIVLLVFPLLGAGSQTIGGMEILRVQSVYLSIIVFGMCLTLNVISELRDTSRMGAYNAQTVLNVMVAGLQQDLALRLEGKELGISTSFNNPPGPSIDADGYYALNADVGEDS